MFYAFRLPFAKGAFIILLYVTFFFKNVCGKRSNLILANDLQVMISYKLLSHSEPLGPTLRGLKGIFDMMTPPPPFDIEELHDMASILFSKQGHNYSQVSFLSHLHLYLQDFKF